LPEEMAVVFRDMESGAFNVAFWFNLINNILQHTYTNGNWS